MTKKVSFAPKPTKTADGWVQGNDAFPVTKVENMPAETMKRLTIDVPANLHARIKVACAQRGTKMADEIRALLEQNFSENSTNRKAS